MAAIVKESNLFQGLYPKGFKPYRIKKFDIIIALLLFVISSIAYIKNLTPSVTAGDSGELTTAVYNMGASHPPGYPIYGIFGKLFTFIPVGDIGYRINLFSAIAAAGAILVFYLILLKLLGLNRDKGRISLDVHVPAIAGSIAFAFTRTMWSQAVIGEVYALNTFLVAFMVYIMLLWYEEIINFRNDNKPQFAERLTFLLALVMGFSLTNHQLPVWYIFGFILFLIPFAMLLVSSRQSPGFDKMFASKKEGLFTNVNLIFGSFTGLLLFMLLVMPLISGKFIFIAILLTLAVYLFVIIALNDINDSDFTQQLKDRTGVIIALIIIILIVGVLFARLLIVPNIFYKLRLLIDAKALPIPDMIYPESLPGIWFTIFVIPVFLLGYTLFVRFTELKKEDNWVDRFLYIFMVAFWLMILAVSVYLFLRVRAMSLAGLSEPKPLSWGDTRSFDVLFNHMLRKQYGSPGGNLRNFGGQLKAVFNIAVQQVHWVNMLVAGIGLVYMFFREKVWAIFTLLSGILFTVIMIKFVNFEVDPRTLSFQEVMYIQAFMFMVIYISFGYQLLLDSVGLIKKALVKKEA